MLQIQNIDSQVFYETIRDEEAVDRHVQTRYVVHLKFDRPG